jgi:hypothetical protein
MRATDRRICAAAAYADVCWRMLTYADVCWRMLTYEFHNEDHRPSHMCNGFDVHVHARYALSVRAHLIVICRCCCFTAALLLLYYLRARHALSVRAHLIVICRCCCFTAALLLLYYLYARHALSVRAHLIVTWPALVLGLFSKQDKQLTSIVEQTKHIGTDIHRLQSALTQWQHFWSRRSKTLARPRCYMHTKKKSYTWGLSNQGDSLWERLFCYLQTEGRKSAAKPSV